MTAGSEEALHLYATYGCDDDDDDEAVIAQIAYKTHSRAAELSKHCREENCREIAA